MALVNIGYGTRAASSGVNNVIGALNGTAGYGDAILLTDYSNATNPSLKIKNGNTTSGKALVIRNAENTYDLFTVQRKGGSDVVGVNKTAWEALNGTASSFFVFNDVSSGSHVMADFVFDSNAPATSDSGAMRAVARQPTGNTSIRAGEFQTLRAAAASANGTWGIEVGVHSEVAGSAANYNVGIYISSDHAGWLSTGTRADTGILFTGADGWKDAIRNYHTDGTTVLHRMCNYTSGNDVMGDFIAAASIYTTGQGGTRVGLLSPGGAPSGQTWAGINYDGTNNGVVLSALTSGTAWRNVFLAPSGGDIVAGGALTTTATYGHFYIPAGPGVPTGVPLGHTGTMALYGDSTNNKLYIYSGGAWVALN